MVKTLDEALEENKKNNNNKKRQSKECWIVINPDGSRSCKCYQCGHKTIVAPEKVLRTLPLFSKE